MFCGRGGWSKPFIEDGDDVWGIDIKNYDYPGKLIKDDVHNLDGYGFSDMDVIIGSPPCTEFSVAREIGRNSPRNLEKGLNTIADFHRFVSEAQPTYWAMENVMNLETWWPDPFIWRFKTSAMGWRTLWGNFAIGISPEFKFNRVFAVSRESRRRWKGTNKTVQDASKRSEIPYPIARFVANTIKELARK